MKKKMSIDKNRLNDVRERIDAIDTEKQRDFAMRIRLMPLFIIGGVLFSMIVQWIVLILS